MVTQSVAFGPAGVTVTLPQQKVEVRIVQLPLRRLAAMPAVPGGFQPFRAVINVAVERMDAPGSYVSEFDPPMQLEVRYTAADSKAAERAGLPLSLGFWDGAQWVRFTFEKHGFQLRPDPSNASQGVATVSISRWEDPIVAWGE